MTNALTYDERFLLERRMFAVRQGTVMIAGEGLAMQHADWLRNAVGPLSETWMAEGVRGYYRHHHLIFYSSTRENAFSHFVPISVIDLVLPLFPLTTYIGRGLRYTETGWQPKVSTDVERYRSQRLRVDATISSPASHS
jgi:hypothetical protein